MAKKKKAAATRPADYERHKQRANAREAAMSAAGREVGDLGLVADPERRLRAARDFGFYAKTYHPERFCLPWSADHLTVIAHIETAILEGGLFAVAMPRGDGKTALAETAAEWAVLNGHREFVAVIGATMQLAKKIIESIGLSLECSPELAEDYPEAVRCFRHLAGIAHRARGQLYRGERTHIQSSGDQLVFPGLRPEGWAKRRDHRPFLRADGRCLSAGCVIRAAGLTGAVRGMMHARPDGSTIRPSLVIPDDPQTDRSARSLSQCETRERLLAGAVLKMCGPGVKMSGVMPCTVIRPGDVADNLLDRDKHPEWNGVRTRMLYSFPTDMKSWERYRDLRADGLRLGDGGRAATELYRANRAAMDEGARVSWPERYNPDELSALQHAMNHFFTDEASFWSEYQNEPLVPDEAAGMLTAEQIAAKVNRHRRGTVPRDLTRLTAFIDVQQKLLYYAVCAWGECFDGAVIDYGTWPDQKRAYHSLADARETLATALPGLSLEAAVYAALEAAADQLCGHAWPVDGGGELRLDRLLVDANWGEMTDAVYLWARQSRHSALVRPAHGRYVGAASNPINAAERKPGEERGLHWRVPVAHARAVRHVLFDTNFYKSFIHERLATPMGGKGGLSLFGERPDAHRMLAEHLTAEARVPTEGRGRKVDEWKARPGRDNHLLDCVAGCAVAAGMLGVSLMGEGPRAAAPKQRVSFAEMQRRARGAR